MEEEDENDDEEEDDDDVGNEDVRRRAAEEKPVDEEEEEEDDEDEPDPELAGLSRAIKASSAAAEAEAGAGSPGRRRTCLGRTGMSAHEMGATTRGPEGKRLWCARHGGQGAQVWLRLVKFSSLGECRTVWRGEREGVQMRAKSSPEVRSARESASPWDATAPLRALRPSAGQRTLVRGLVSRAARDGRLTRCAWWSSGWTDTLVPSRAESAVFVCGRAGDEGGVTNEAPGKATQRGETRPLAPHLLRSGRFLWCGISFGGMR